MVEMRPIVFKAAASSVGCLLEWTIGPALLV